jgi:signal peptidase II
MKPSNTIQRWAILLICAAAVFALDQVSKAWVTANVAFGETVTPIPAIGDFVAITRSANRGAAFSFLPQAGDLFLIIALVMLVAIPIMYRRMQHIRLIEQIAFGLLLGGVAGNALDRIRLGSVVDFVHLQIRPFVSNVSNFADHAIVIAIVILFITQWIGDRKASQTPTPSETNEPPAA